MEARAIGHVRGAHASLVVILLSIMTGLLMPAITFAQAEQPMHHDHAGNQSMAMPMDEPMDVAAHLRMQAKIRADKQESEFNHHLAGFFVAAAGIFVLFQSNLA